MASETFMIRWYNVAHTRSTTGPKTTLHLTGDVLEGGTLSAMLYFTPTVTAFSGQKVDDRVIVNLPYEDFPVPYDFLRHETPLLATCRYPDEDSETGGQLIDLESFAVYTHKGEPPGEGPSDSSPLPL